MSKNAAKILLSSPLTFGLGWLLVEIICRWGRQPFTETLGLALVDAVVATSIYALIDKVVRPSR